jgi:2,3-diaminopropionate biosynthesis protein SbnB
MSEIARPVALDIVIASDIENVLAREKKTIVALVENAYALYGNGKAAIPECDFLRFPDNQDARIIALPAHLNDIGNSVAGIKWISSFPQNLAKGLRRASAVVILNDVDTGYPYACLEGSLISAARTAASASIGAKFISNGACRIDRLGIIGTGLIASHILDYLEVLGWSTRNISLFDQDHDRAHQFRNSIRETFCCGDIRVDVDFSDVVRESDFIVLTTTAKAPYILETELFSHNPRVLNVSLRDIGPDVILMADNVVDDTNHCLKANTSPHLAAMKAGNHAFIKANIYDLITGAVKLQFPSTRPVIFSPFGMGVLDLAVAKFVYEQLKVTGNVVSVPNFFLS